MGEWRPGEWYDDGGWMGPKKYAPRWPANWATVRFLAQAKKILELGGTDAAVLDLGSGNGMFAAMLWHQGHRGRYMGFDFSPGSLADAVEGNKNQGGHQQAVFELCDLEQANVTDLLDEYDMPLSTVVTTGECLEHMKNDRRIVSTIPEGTICVVTLPRFDAEAHIRWWYEQRDLAWYWKPFFAGWQQEWIAHRCRDPERQCHMFWGARNGFEWAGETWEGAVVAPPGWEP